MRPAGFEPATLILEGCCSVRLSYGRPGNVAFVEPDPAVAVLLAGNAMTAVPDDTGKLLYLIHVPTGIGLERAVFPDLLNVSHAVDALLGEAAKTGWAAPGSNREPPD